MPLLDQRVEIDERARRDLGHARPHRRLAGPHEAGDGEVPP